MLSNLDPRVRRLLLRLPLAGAAALAVWFFAGLSSAYGGGVTAGTEAFIRAFERPKETFLTWEDDIVIVRRADFYTRSDLPGYKNLSAITGNLVLLLTLLLATPGIAAPRVLLRGTFSVLALFASHVVHFALAIERIYATQLGAWSAEAYPRWQRELIATSGYFFDIALKFALPFVFWALLVLLPELRKEGETEGAAAPAKKPPGKRRKK